MRTELAGFFEVITSSAARGDTEAARERIIDAGFIFAEQKNPAFLEVVDTGVMSREDALDLAYDDGSWNHVVEFYGEHLLADIESTLRTGDDSFLADDVRNIGEDAREFIAETGASEDNQHRLSDKALRIITKLEDVALLATAKTDAQRIREEMLETLQEVEEDGSPEAQDDSAKMRKSVRVLLRRRGADNVLALYRSLEPNSPYVEDILAATENTLNLLSRIADEYALDTCRDVIKAHLKETPTVSALEEAQQKTRTCLRRIERFCDPRNLSSKAYFQVRSLNSVLGYAIERARIAGEVIDRDVKTLRYTASGAIVPESVTRVVLGHKVSVLRDSKHGAVISERVEGGDVVRDGQPSGAQLEQAEQIISQVVRSAPNISEQYADNPEQVYRVASSALRELEATGEIDTARALVSTGVLPREGIIGATEFDQSVQAAAIRATMRPMATQLKQGMESLWEPETSIDRSLRNIRWALNDIGNFVADIDNSRAAWEETKKDIEFTKMKLRHRTALRLLTRGEFRPDIPIGEAFEPLLRFAE